MFEESINEYTDAGTKRLGKLPAKSSMKQLHFARLVKAEPAPPAAVNFWTKRKAFLARTYGNTENGCCVRASQAVAATRMERIEQRRSIEISTDEVLRVYYDMTSRLYGGGDTGAYETDGLSEWRKPDLTFRDAKKRPHTIDAFLKVNHADVDEVKRAIAFSGVHGIKACFALPAAWSSVNIPNAWDMPEGQQMTGQWLPNSWGGHSTSVFGYNAAGPWIAHTWYEGGKEVDYGLQQVTWRGFMAFCDEVFIVMDSVNGWKKRGDITKRQAEAIASAVNSVSDTKIAA